MNHQFTSHMKLFSGARPLKRWRYVGVFCEQLMACAALVQVGPARQSFWALAPGDGGELRERTRRLPRRDEVELAAAARRRSALAVRASCASTATVSRWSWRWRKTPA